MGELGRPTRVELTPFSVSPFPPTLALNDTHHPSAEPA